MQPDFRPDPQLAALTPERGVSPKNANPPLEKTTSADPPDPRGDPRRVKLERFAIFTAQGHPPAEAYKLAGFEAKFPTSAAKRLLAKPQVARRVSELTAQFNQHIEERFQLSKDEAIAYLVEIIRTPIGQIDENHYLCQSMRPNKFGLELAMPNKVAAIRELREMLPGWSAARDIHIGPTQEMVDILRAVRNGEPLPKPKPVIQLPPPSL